MSLPGTALMVIPQPDDVPLNDRSLATLLSSLVIALMAGAGVAQLQILFGF